MGASAVAPASSPGAVMSSPSADVESRVRLLRAAGTAPVALTRLLDRHDGDAASALAAGRGAWRDSGLPASAVDALTHPPDTARMDADLAWLSQPGRTLLFREDPGYPPRLRGLPDPPVALWVDGRAPALATPQLAIVGSRNPTRGGERTAREFAGHLAGVGLTITSGLALGIDAAAHDGALAAGGEAVAVLGCGCDVIYPRRHAALHARVVAGGAVVSEYPPGTPPLPAHFPARNRLLAGLSVGVLVVEAAARSGSLITARLAGEQGREVFAIPGSIHNPLARGCHRLIRDGARLVETADDVLGELAGVLGDWLRPRENVDPAGAERAGQPDRTHDPDYARVMEAIDFEPVSMDELHACTGLTPATLSSMLLILELEGAVEALPGGRYVRLPPASAPN